MKNYIVFEGKKIPLTDEQVEMLRSSKKPEEVTKSPFERVRGKGYYFIQYNGTVEYDFDRDSAGDIYCFANANYCTDKELMRQRALHEILNRLLWRFSMENGEGENPWDCEHSHWVIKYVHDSGVFCTRWTTVVHNAGAIYFSTDELARRAIEEIIKPFMKEHPEFVW